MECCWSIAPCLKLQHLKNIAVCSCCERGEAGKLSEENLSVLYLRAGCCSPFCTLPVPCLDKKSTISKFKYQMLLLNLKWLMEGYYLHTCYTGSLYFCLVSPQSRNNNPTISILCSESAFKMQQRFLPSNCPQQPLKIWAINYQWMSTCAVAFNLIFGLSFLIFFSITLPVSFFFLFFSCHWVVFFCFFQSYVSHILGCIPRIEILTFSFISHVQFVGSDNSFHSEKYCFREISFKTQQQLSLFLSVAIPKKYQLPTCLNSNQHLQVMAPDTLWYKNVAENSWSGSSF